MVLVLKASLSHSLPLPGRLCHCWVASFRSYTSTGRMANTFLVGTRTKKLLTNPAFVQVEKEAYWGEVVDNRYYQVPQLDKCSQAAMLSEPISFRAPPNGIMFMQFLAPSCSECTQLTQAIEAFVAQNPQMPVRWVQVTVPNSVGKLSK